jgi:hypothetical protein
MVIVKNIKIKIFLEILEYRILIFVFLFFFHLLINKLIKRILFVDLVVVARG